MKQSQKETLSNLIRLYQRDLISLLNNEKIQGIMQSLMEGKQLFFKDSPREKDAPRRADFWYDTERACFMVRGWVTQERNPFSGVSITEDGMEEFLEEYLEDEWELI